jgi:thiosulfate/3-mercaptopyruvate sulfurtransferase
VSGQRYSTLVDAATVAANLGRTDWLVCDVRHQLADPTAGERAYGADHIPGAAFLHLDRELSGPKNGQNGRHPLPDPLRLAALFGRLGIDAGTQVVAYDDAGGMIAGRLWWLFRWLGHDHVALLDGGYPAWRAAGFPVTGDTASRLPRDFVPAIRTDLLASADEVLAGIGNPEGLVVDARSPDRFRGENETLDPVGGHIPGATNRFFKDNLDAQGMMKPAKVLRDEYLRLAGDRSTAKLIHQCGSGVSACLNMVAMAHAGLDTGRLYAGSWSEWCTPGAGRPVERQSN